MLEERYEPVPPYEFLASLEEVVRQIGRFGFKKFEKFSKSGFSLWVDSMLIGKSDGHVESSEAYRILE